MVVYIVYINDARSSKYQKMKYILIKYIKKRSLEISETPSYIVDARYLKVKKKMKSANTRPTILQRACIDSGYTVRIVCGKGRV